MLKLKNKKILIFSKFYSLKYKIHIPLFLITPFN